MSGGETPDAPRSAVTQQTRLYEAGGELCRAGDEAANTVERALEHRDVPDVDAAIARAGATTPVVQGAFADALELLEERP